MIELLDLIFSPANAIATTLFLLIIVYWVVVILGMLDTEFLDFDLDFDGEPDIDVDIDADAATSADISWLNHVLIFFNLGKVPFMVWLSFLAIPLWLVSVSINDLLGIENFFLGLIVLLPVFIGSLFVAKIATWPFISFFSKLDEETKEKSILGRVGTVKLKATHTSKGQAEINYNGTFLDFYILAKDKGVVLEKGSKVEFVKPTDDPGTFWVEPYYTID